MCHSEMGIYQVPHTMLGKSQVCSTWRQSNHVLVGMSRGLGWNESFGEDFVSLHMMIFFKYKSD